MPNAKPFQCVITEIRWLTPTVLGIRARANKSIRFEAGQFLAVEIPTLYAATSAKRLYSFASPPGGLFGTRDFELCVKYQMGGLGSEYLLRLKAGDTIDAWAPYGDFVYDTDPSRSVCFIATGTGIAPMRSIILSQKFQADPPHHATLLFGAKDASEILYPGIFQNAGCEVIYALSQERNPENVAGANMTRRRVTDYLESLPKSWNWHGTDFYLCGNGKMIEAVTLMLTQAYGVSPSAIHAEAFGSSGHTAHAKKFKKSA